MTGAFGVGGENENDERNVDFCADREICVMNYYFGQSSGSVFVKSR